MEKEDCKKKRLGKRGFVILKREREKKDDCEKKYLRERKKED